MRDPHSITLGSLKPREVIKVSCGCRTMTLFMAVTLERRHGLGPDTLVLSLLPRFVCDRCGQKNVTMLSIVDETNAADSSLPVPETVLFQREG